MQANRHERKARLLQLVSDMRKKGIVIEFASHPCFQKKQDSPKMVSGIG